MTRRLASRAPSDREDSLSTRRSSSSTRPSRRWHRLAGLAAIGAVVAACSSGGDATPTAATTTAPNDSAADPVLSLTDVEQPPEDILSLNGTDFFALSSITAGDHPGGLRLFDRTTSTETELWPVPGFTYTPDLAAFPGCDTPPDESRAATHGINAVQTGAGTFDLYVVYHGSRESVEIFALDLRGENPQASWRGCVLAPEGVAANGVAATPDGGIAITNFTDPREPLLPQLFTGEPSGSVWTWNRINGWTEVSGSQAFGPNGLEVSPDGQTFYVAEAMKKRVVSIPATGGEFTELATIDFLPDNLRWTESGTLLTTGMAYEPLTAQSIQSCAMEGTGCIPGFSVVEIDPATRSSDTVYSTDSADYQYATVAVQVDSDLWVGGNAISKIAVVSGQS